MMPAHGRALCVAERRRDGFVPKRRVRDGSPVQSDRPHEESPDVMG